MTTYVQRWKAWEDGDVVSREPCMLRVAMGAYGDEGLTSSAQSSQKQECEKFVTVEKPRKLWLPPHLSELDMDLGWSPDDVKPRWTAKLEQASGPRHARFQLRLFSRTHLSTQRRPGVSAAVTSARVWRPGCRLDNAIMHFGDGPWGIARDGLGWVWLPWDGIGRHEFCYALACSCMS